MAHAGVHGEVHVFRVNICKQVGKNKEKYTAKAGDENLATKDTSLSYRSEEHTSELQSRPHISYAVFCLKKKKQS